MRHPATLRLNHKDERQRRRAVRKLFEVNDSNNLDSFVPLLEDDDQWYRERAMEAITKWAGFNDNTIVNKLSSSEYVEQRVLASKISLRLGQEKLEIIDPDILIIEGINVLQPIISKDNNMPLIISDFLDFSIYIDAEEPSLRTWYIDRFLSLRQAALNNEEDFFNRFSSINDDQAKEIANSIWEKINLINLNENILPTKYKANLILKKNINHKTNEIWLRNI